MKTRRTLDRIAESTGSLFDGLPPTPTNPIRPVGQVPKCPLCRNYGYVNCPQAILPDGRDLIAVAFEKGTACTCAAGVEFAKNQMEWMR